MIKGAVSNRWGSANYYFYVEVFYEPPMMGKVPPYLKISCIKGHKESISIVVPAEVNGENNVTVSSKEVGKQTLPEFISFDRSTGTFRILITKES